MLKTGKEHLDSLRDGRVVFVGKERIDDVTTHPPFSRAGDLLPRGQPVAGNGDSTGW